MNAKSYDVGGVPMQLPIMVGAGVCKTPESVGPYMRQDVSVGAVLTGSYTPKSRAGNEGTLFWPFDWREFEGQSFGLNSYGMPNCGYAEATRKLPSDPLHPMIVSIAGFSVDDYVEGVEVFDALPGVAAIELNLGCPNVQDEKPLPMSYDLDSLERLLYALKSKRPKKPLWLKLSPYVTDQQLFRFRVTYAHLDFSQVPLVEAGFLGVVMSCIFDYPGMVRAVGFSNTLPNVIGRDKAGKPVTTPNQGKAGLSGPLMKEVSTELIRQALRMLPGTFDFIGSGGVLTGNDAMDYLEVGASAVQCTSGPFWYGDGPRFFANLIADSERLQTYLSAHETTN